MSKVFKVTQSNQYIQTVALSKGEYVFQCNVKHHKDVLTIALKDGSNVWHEYEVPCKKNTWVDKAQLKFTTTVDMTAFSLCYKDASTQNPVYIEKPVLKMGAEIGIISPNYKDLIEELESSLVINNGEGSLLNGLLDITELTNDKGSANLSLDVGKSILRKNVSLVKNKEGKDGNSPTVGANGNWHIGGVDTGIKAEGVSPHIGSNGNWYVGTVDTGIKAKGDKGDTGLAGQIPIQKEWVAGDLHRNNDEIVDYIYVRGENKEQSYWFKLKEGIVNLIADAPPENGTTPPNYVKINWLKALAVNVLLAEEANVAGFIFKGNQLISERGTVDGVGAYYSGQANFVPNLILNGAEGDVKITGTVNATSGILDSVTVTNADIENVTISNADIKDATIDGLLKVSSGYEGKIGDYNLFWIAPMPAKILTVPTTYDSKGKSIKFYNASSTVSHTLNLLVIGYKLNSNGEIVLTNYTLSDEAKGARRDSVFIPPRGSVEVSCFEIPPGNYKSTGGDSDVYDRVLSWEMTNRNYYNSPE